MREGQFFEANGKLDVARANDILYLELCEFGLYLKVKFHTADVLIATQLVQPEIQSSE